MSRSNDGKCPDKGAWCGCIREICEGDCEVREHDRIMSAFATVAKIAKEMRQEYDIAPRILMDGWATALEMAIAEWTEKGGTE